MKNLNPLLLFFLVPIYGYAQQLSGTWTGVLSNDSITIRKDQSFEITLTEYRGKVYGYSYSSFIVNDSLYYIIKRVKGKIKGDVCEVEDEEVVTHNFKKKPDKGVYVIYTFRRNLNESDWNLEGDWKTNATKKYFALSGGVKAKLEKDLSRSKLYDHLGDLKLQNTFAFDKLKDSEKKTPKVKEVKNDVAKAKVKSTNKKQDAEVAIARADVKKQDTINNKLFEQEMKPDIVKADQKTDKNKSSPEYIFTELKKTERKLKLAATMLTERKSVPSETIYFKSDSLVLALYDNGEVDGDTVSVIFDRELIIEKQVLKSVAFKQTIYLSPDESDSVLLVLYAENLGIYPPNTGLLIIKDGEENYYVRFKADYDRNAAILLRKKLK
jgi:hypothetical protein